MPQDQQKQNDGLGPHLPTSRVNFNRSSVLINDAPATENNSRLQHMNLMNIRLISTRQAIDAKASVIALPAVHTTGVRDKPESPFHPTHTTASVEIDRTTALFAATMRIYESNRGGTFILGYLLNVLPFAICIRRQIYLVMCSTDLTTKDLSWVWSIGNQIVNTLYSKDTS